MKDFLTRVKIFNQRGHRQDVVSVWVMLGVYTALGLLFLGVHKSPEQVLSGSICLIFAVIQWVTLVNRLLEIELLPSGRITNRERTFYEFPAVSPEVAALRDWRRRRKSLYLELFGSRPYDHERDGL